MPWPAGGAEEMFECLNWECLNWECLNWECLNWGIGGCLNWGMFELENV